MMFEKQQVSGSDKPSAQSTVAIENNPTQVEPKTTQLHQQVTRHSPDDVDTVFRDAQKVPDIETSEDLGANVSGSGTVQPAIPVILID